MNVPKSNPSTSVKNRPKPTARLLTALELLQSRQRVTGTELAQSLQVDKRTVRRYICALEDMGIPIIAERGRDGAYSLARGFKLPPMMFTNDEAIAIGTGLIAARQLGMSSAAVAIASVQAKIDRVLPESIKVKLRALDDTVALDIPSHSTAIDSQMFSTVSNTAQRQQRVELEYVDGQQNVTTRTVNPYAMAFYLGRWFVVGWCHTRQDLRTFRLDRVRHATALPATFARPEKFDVLKYLRTAMAVLPRGHRVSVVFKAPLDEVRQWIAAEFGILQAIPDMQHTRLISEVDELDWFCRVLASTPLDFKIESPKALRQQMFKHTQRLAHATESINE